MRISRRFKPGQGINLPLENPAFYTKSCCGLTFCDDVGKLSYYYNDLVKQCNSRSLKGITIAVEPI